LLTIVMCSDGKVTDVDGEEMCMHDTGDIQRWLHNKVKSAKYNSHPKKISF
jgi:hypothetical protein